MCDRTAKILHFFEIRGISFLQILLAQKPIIVITQIMSTLVKIISIINEKMLLIIFAFWRMLIFRKL